MGVALDSTTKSINTSFFIFRYIFKLMGEYSPRVGLA
jgi:hypothetical protein